MTCKRLSLVAVILVGLALGGTGSLAQACGHCGVRSAAWPHGYDHLPRSYHNVPLPPYFALHPPVYYGARVYRPYGASPFAWSPASEPHRVVAASEPQSIRNPYYRRESAAPVSEEISEPQPLPAPPSAVQPSAPGEPDLAPPQPPVPAEQAPAADEGSPSEPPPGTASDAEASAARARHVVNPYYAGPAAGMREVRVTFFAQAR